MFLEPDNVTEHSLWLCRWLNNIVYMCTVRICVGSYWRSGHEPCQSLWTSCRIWLLYIVHYWQLVYTSCGQYKQQHSIALHWTPVFVTLCRSV